MIVIHDPEDVAVQAHPVSAVTLKLPVAVLAETDVLTGEIEYVQDCPVCVTLKGRPPMVMAPLRDEVVGFAVTLNPTWPLAEPLAPEVTVIHAAPLAAVHEHPVCAVTPTVPEPAAGPSVVLTGLSV